MHDSDASLGKDEAFAGELFGTDVPNVDVQAAYEATLLRTRRPQPWITMGAVAAVAAVVIGAFALTPLGGFAAQLLTIFEPQTFAPIAINAADREQLRLAPQLRSLGTFHVARTRSAGVTTLAQAQASVGFQPRMLTYAPNGKAVRAQYVVLSRATTTFTFSAAKARAYAERNRRTLPPMPPKLDGTTIGVTTGPGIVTMFGERRAKDGLIFLQMQSPHVTSTGASLDVLENYLLALPNVPASVATQLRAISDPQRTLPIPVAIDRNHAVDVDVDGVRGLALGDETGLGSAVMWQKNGMSYAITGAVPLKQLVAIANGIK